ncbi:MAG: S41 family peptidase [Bacteroidota bacterium]
MLKNRKKLLVALVLTVTVSVGFVTKVSDNYFEISKNLDIFGKLYRDINILYVDEVDPTRMMRTGIDAMLGKLDPYTTFISESEIEDFKFMSTGQYGGIGAMVGSRDGKIMVIERYKGYPADKSGLIAGDQLLAVDGQPLRGDESIKEMRAYLRGEKGTQLKVLVKRADKEPFEVQVTRDRIRINNVPYYGMVNNDIGYISLTGFTQDAGKEVREALLSLKSTQPKLKGVILDLRGNPGGRLDEAVNVSNVFIKQGTKIVETRGKDQSSNRNHFARNAPTDLNIPVAVLVNSRSASASEIVAGSIQDKDRGIIVGQRSFGKGLVQNIRGLSYGTQLKVTTAKYYTPSGRCIQAIDYSNRAEDGSVGKVPDSLKTAFKTDNGRVVYDGGGVEPDVKVEKPMRQTITRELQTQNLIFNFATKFVQENPEIASPQEFEINDNIYNQFVAFVEQQDFDYETQADKKLTVLKEALEEETYYESLSEELETFRQHLEDHKDRDLSHFKKDISRLLLEEIVGRYYYKEGVIEASFRKDPDVVAAVKTITDQKAYTAILQGNQ